jgi:nucleotide-binding universal stress UspA family protein
MATISKILCPVDFSKHSNKIAAYAETLGTALGATVEVVYIAPSLSQYESFQVPAGAIASMVGDIITGAEKTMDSFVQENFKNIKAEGKVLSGDAAQEILDYAREHKVDLIVMGTHGRKGIDRVLFGSVAEKVVKTSTVPVLTVHPG